jgi:hypothetical protein
MEVFPTPVFPIKTTRWIGGDGIVWYRIEKLFERHSTE